MIVTCLAVRSTATAQDTPAASAATAPAWEWSADANAFVGFNYQRRQFRDFSAWESQNWMMAGAERRSAVDRLRLSAMLSFEALTLQDIGSPQVFQTGETFNDAPLVDYQHPHDLVMGLGGNYQRRIGRARLLIGADVVGPPTLGPMCIEVRPGRHLIPG